MLEGVFSVVSCNILLLSTSFLLCCIYPTGCHKNIPVLHFVYDVHKTWMCCTWFSANDYFSWLWSSHTICFWHYTFSSLVVFWTWWPRMLFRASKSQTAVCCSNVLFYVVVCVSLIFSSDVMHIKYVHTGIMSYHECRWFSDHIAHVSVFWNMKDFVSIN